MLRARLVRSHASSVGVDVRHGDEKHWMIALKELVVRGDLDVAKYAARELRRAFPDAPYAATIASTLERLPPRAPDERFANWPLDDERELQIVPRAGAACVLFAFTGLRGALGMELWMMHRWFGLLGVHVVYLRDWQSQGFNDGIAELAGNYDDTLDALATVVERLEARHVICYGNSLGGYAALRYGLDLGASGVLVFGAPTDLSASSTVVRQGGVRTGPNLRFLYEAALRSPTVRLVYGADHERDAREAVNFAGLPNVTLEPAPGFAAHNSWRYFIERGTYDRLLRELVQTADGETETWNRRRVRHTE